jgi:hypothetical protein
MRLVNVRLRRVLDLGGRLKTEPQNLLSYIMQLRRFGEAFKRGWLAH